jgi:hypothetical protein
MIDWTRVLTTVAATGLTAVVGAIITLLLHVSRDLKIMRERGDLRIKENRLLFKGLLGVIDAMRTGKTNGNLTEVETDIKQYLNETAIH